ncbi:MAG: hypothetical protein LBV41_06600 [Cytophagaceae bacterium]|nr:hypothetical protein [Cytophagaceae bacterium]
MKRLFFSIVMMVALGAMVLTSCNGNEPVDEPTVTESDELKGEIADVRTLNAYTTYKLTAPLIIKDGGELNIPAGTVIKAQKGFDKYILVLQGGKINVNGTADKPVVMTSGESSPATEDWGGLIVNGRAPLAGEGTATTEINSDYEYGGSNAADNSGVITYLKLEYTGARNSADVEHNGLTLNGVGSGTRIENVYIPNGADDGIEFFGGSVSVKNLLVVNSDDDMFDMTYGWNGTLENCYGVWQTGFASSESDPSGVEADGNFDGNFPEHTGQSDFTIRNMTVDLNSTDLNNVLKVRRGAKATIINALVKGSGTVKTSGAVVDMTDSKGNGNIASNISITNALTSEPPATATKFGDDAYQNIVVGGNNNGCDSSIFGWTGYKF